MHQPLRKSKHFPPQPVSPSPKELSRYQQRRRARLLGFELPLTTREAAEYVGFHRKTVERMARAGLVPAHPVCGVRRKTWMFYASELDVWLRAKVNQSRHASSPDGKEAL